MASDFIGCGLGASRFCKSGGVGGDKAGKRCGAGGADVVFEDRGDNAGGAGGIIDANTGGADLSSLKGFCELSAGGVAGCGGACETKTGGVGGSIFAVGVCIGAAGSFSSVFSFSMIVLV